MKTAEMKVYKDRLLALRARLRGEVTQLAEAALKKNSAQAGSDHTSMPIHMADLGSDAYEQEFTLSLMETEEDTLGLIETALERIEEETYGKCEECGIQIPKTRLNVLPYTPYCIKCADKVHTH